MNALRFLVPDGVDDPARVSGGNVYDREVRDGLRRRGWTVSVAGVADAAGAASELASAPAGSLVLIDGLVAGRAADALGAAASRVRIVVLTHMVAAAFPDALLADAESERRSLDAAHHVIATSRWTADELVSRGLVGRDRITIAAPGAHEAVLGAGQGRDLLCVGVIAPHKGQDILLSALERLRGTDWTCSLVGSTAPFPGFARRVAHEAAGFGGRVRLTGVLDPERLAGEYRRSALLVAPSRIESAGMAIADARARGIPVIAAEVGGIPDRVAGGGALLVRPDDPVALAAKLGAWMTDPSLRDRLRREAAVARPATPSWEQTVTTIEDALTWAR
jgi:glycosyltransferase involved in cell wall biosynthesis